MYSIDMRDMPYRYAAKSDDKEEVPRNYLY